MPDHFSFDALHLCQLPSIEVCELQLWFASSKGVGLKLHWKRWWGKCIVMLLLLQAAFIESLKACAGAPFFTCCFCSLLFCRLRCGVRRLELHWLSEFFTLVQWWWWSWTVELSRLPEVIHCCSHIGELVCACQIWINWLQLNWKKTIYDDS